MTTSIRIDETVEDGTYGPYAIVMMIDVKDGKASLSLHQDLEGTHYVLSQGGDTLKRVDPKEPTSPTGGAIFHHPV